MTMAEAPPPFELADPAAELAVARVRLGLTAGEMAGLLGVASEATVRSWERRKHRSAPVGASLAAVIAAEITAEYAWRAADNALDDERPRLATVRDPAHLTAIWPGHAPRLLGAGWHRAATGQAALLSTDRDRIEVVWWDPAGGDSSRLIPLPEVDSLLAALGYGRAGVTGDQIAARIAARADGDGPDAEPLANVWDRLYPSCTGRARRRADRASRPGPESS